MYSSEHRTNWGKCELAQELIIIMKILTLANSTNVRISLHRMLVESIKRTSNTVNYKNVLNDLTYTFMG